MAKTTNLSSFDPRNENLQEILKEVTDQNYSVFVARKDNKGRNVYGFLYGDVGNEQVVRSDAGLPVEFIYEEIQPAKQRIELLQTIAEAKAKEEIAKQEAEEAAQIEMQMEDLSEKEKAQLERLSGSRLIDADIVDAKTWDKLQNTAYRTKMM
jgi:chorismate mutase